MYTFYMGILHGSCGRLLHLMEMWHNRLQLSTPSPHPAICSLLYNLSRGPGVVGEQPILAPGKSFEYQSACPLYTTFGTMEGEFEMVTLNDQGEWMDRMEARIGRFALIKPDMA